MALKVAGDLIVMVLPGTSHHPHFFKAQEIFSQTYSKKVVILHKTLLQSFWPIYNLVYELCGKLLKDNISLKQLFFFPVGS